MHKEQKQEREQRRDRLLARIIEDHSQTLYALCVAYYPFNQRQRDELYNNMLYHIWCRLNRFCDDTNLGAWTYKVAHNYAVDYWRIQHLRERVFRPFESEPVADRVDDEVEDQRLETLYRLIEHLKPRERELVSLYLQDLPDSELAERMGITMTNLATRMSRIRKKLKTIYENEKHPK